jgi:hypothetical protein
VSLETYTLELTETAERDALSADVYGSDGCVVRSTRVRYENHATLGEPDGETPAPLSSEVTADVLSLSLQYEVTDAGVSFHVVGDGDILLTERATPGEWGFDAA